MMLLVGLIVWLLHGDVSQRDLKAVEAGYGENVLNLTLARSYIRRLLDNPAVTGFLKASHAEIFGEFKVIATTET